jgi:PhnB protein
MVKPIPDEYRRITPYVCVEPAAAAIDFYTRIFGATETVRMPGDAPDKVGHAELQIGDSVLMLSDPFPAMGARSAKEIGGTPVTLLLYVEDVDKVFPAAIEAGATEVRAVEDQFYGDRSGQLDDPFGIRWNLATHVEDVSPEDMEKRMAEMGNA